MGESKRVGAQEKVLSHSSCQSRTPEHTASTRNTTCEAKQDLGVALNTTAFIRLLCLDFSSGSTY